MTKIKAIENWQNKILAYLSDKPGKYIKIDDIQIDCIGNEVRINQ